MKKLLILFLLLSAVQSQARHRKFRTDGFYFYDNGIDTIRTIPNSEVMQAEVMELLKQVGAPQSPLPATDCGQRGLAVLSEGSTLMHYLAFVNDTGGVMLGGTCRKKEAIANCLDLICKHPSMVQDKIHGLHFIDDSTFVFYNGHEKTFGDKPLAELTEVFTCKIRNNGSLDVYYMIKGNMPVAYPNRTYRFIPYNNIPADLGLKH